MDESPEDGARAPEDPGASPSFDTSLRMLMRAKAGEAEALDQLLRRYLPSLQRWASGRMPRWARERCDTNDLIQETIIGLIPHIEDFQPRREGALRAYMRQALLNRIRTEIRRTQVRPRRQDVDVASVFPSPAASPLEEAIGKETVERYEAALMRLRAEDRETIIASLEMQCTLAELAQVLDKPSADAARMAVNRAIVRLAKEMNRGTR